MSGRHVLPPSLTNTADPVIVACLYAKQNGFTNGANGGKQKVSVEANTTASPVAGISPSYWISVTVSEKLPLTFLSVLGTQWANVAFPITPFAEARAPPLFQDGINLAGALRHNS